MKTETFDRPTVLRIQHLCGVKEDGDFGPVTLAGVLETLELAAKTVPALVVGTVQTSGAVIFAPASGTGPNA